MNVKLIAVDGKIPNLALMQLSAWHKEMGDTVGFDIQDPDQVYISCIFKENADQARGIAEWQRSLKAKVSVGGSGINKSWLPAYARKIKPDYDLYPSTYAQGCTSRGCIRACPFCIVQWKEGAWQRWNHISEFWDDRFDTAMLMDNNILADWEWFKSNAEFLIEYGINVIEHGMDVRILDEKRIQLLERMDFPKGIHFAFDRMQDEPAVRAGIALLKDHGFNVKRDVQFYVLAGYPKFSWATFIHSDVYRCNVLKRLGASAYVMPYSKKTEWIRRLTKWADRKKLFWSCSFEDYLEEKTGVRI